MKTMLMSRTRGAMMILVWMVALPGCQEDYLVDRALCPSYGTLLDDPELRKEVRTLLGGDVI